MCFAILSASPETKKLVIIRVDHQFLYPHSYPRPQKASIGTLHHFIYGKYFPHYFYYYRKEMTMRYRIHFLIWTVQHFVLTTALSLTPAGRMAVQLALSIIVYKSLDIKLWFVSYGPMIVNIIRFISEILSCISDVISIYEYFYK